MVDYAISELQWRREVVVEGRGKRITKTKKKKENWYVVPIFVAFIRFLSPFFCSIKFNFV